MTLNNHAVSIKRKFKYGHISLSVPESIIIIVVILRFESIIFYWIIMFYDLGLPSFDENGKITIYRQRNIYREITRGSQVHQSDVNDSFWILVCLFQVNYQI